MTRTIVVGYDGSDHGDDALALGRLLARIAEAELVVACAYPADPLGESAAGLEVARELREDAEQRLGRARTWLDGAVARSGAANAADAALADGGTKLQAIAGASPSHVLHVLAEELRAEAIVVGASHHGKGLRLLSGSTPEAVLDHAPCPVAVAPDGYRDSGGGGGDGGNAALQVAVAFDGSPESRHALAVAAAWARRAGARLRLVTAVNSAAVGIYPPPPLDVAAYQELGDLARAEAQGRIQEAIASLGGGVVAEGAVIEGDPVASLVEDSRREDLLFTGSGTKGAFRRVLLGSVSTHLLREATCPVVVVPRGGGEGA